MKLLLKIAAVGAVVYGVVLLNRWAHARTLDESGDDDAAEDAVDDGADDELAAAATNAFEADIVSEPADPVPVPQPKPTRRKNLRT